MKLAIVGSRSLTDINLDKYLQDEHPDEVVSGGARGIDMLAEQWARSHGVPVTTFLPDYSRYGRRAPLVRNDQIVEAADKVIALWDGKSTGTMYTVRKAEKMGKPVELHKIAVGENQTPTLF